MDLSSAEARYELAKDASAFANATGGVIVVGFRTAKVSSADTDAIATTELMPESGFPALAIQGVLRDCLHPGIRGLRVYWQESAKTATLGFGVIEVPAQLEESLRLELLASPRRARRSSRLLRDTPSAAALPVCRILRLSFSARFGRA